MLIIIEWQLPFQDPVLIFLIALLLLLLVPPLLQRLRIPGMVGLLLAGAVLGPHGAQVLERGEAITLFGTVGLLYLMFWAGLEIDLHDFFKNRHKSLLFGMLTFLIPLSTGFSVAYWGLAYRPEAALLLASMFSTHTLIAYPIVNRLGLARNEAVTIAIGGTIITDTLALLVLTGVSTAVHGGWSGWMLLSLLFSLTAFALVVGWGLPVVARWFFRRVESDAGLQYVFVLTAVFFSAFAAEVAGFEPIIGAFLAGLALNRLIPHTSPLMSRIEFVGNHLFIPFFLLSVGMLVDLRLAFSGTAILSLALLLIGVAFGSKWLAAWITQRTFGYQGVERELMFGLSSAHAAATIAIILVGFQIGLLNEAVLNASILLIFASCLGSSLITDRAARALVVREGAVQPAQPETHQRLLVPVANPATLERLIDLALLLRDPASTEPVYPLSVILDDSRATGRIAANRRTIEQLVRKTSETGISLYPVNRLDVSPATGIIRTIKELSITTVLMGWNTEITPIERFFGGVVDKVLEESRQLLLVTRMQQAPVSFQRIRLVVSPLAHLEPGFKEWLRITGQLIRRLRASVAVWGDPVAVDTVARQLKTLHRLSNVSSSSFTDWEAPELVLNNLLPGDLLVVAGARHRSISHSSFCEALPALLADPESSLSFILLYPALGGESGSDLLGGGL